MSVLTSLTTHRIKKKLGGRRETRGGGGGGGGRNSGRGDIPGLTYLDTMIGLVAGILAGDCSVTDHYQHSC